MQCHAFVRDDDFCGERILSLCRLHALDLQNHDVPAFVLSEWTSAASDTNGQLRARLVDGAVDLLPNASYRAAMMAHAFVAFEGL